jgi:hypothetical protein
MALEAWIGEVLLFPVTDPAKTLPAFGSDPNYKPEMFYVKTMVPLILKDVGKVNKTPDQTGTCTVTAPSPLPGGGTIALEGEGEALGCFDLPLKSISGIVVTAAGLGVLQQGKDYGFDPSTGLLTLKLDVPGSVSVSFQWTKEGKFMCGDHTSANASAICIEASWAGTYCCASEPGEDGLDLGVRAIRLAKPAGESG